MNRKGFTTLIIIWIIVGIIAVIGFFWLSAQIYCGQKETQIPIPAFLQGAQIKFENSMYYQIGNQQEQTPTFTKIGREIVEDQTMNTYYPGRFTFEPVATSTMFDVVGAINSANCGLASVDSGTRGVDFLILQDPQGRQSLIFTGEFTFTGKYNEAVNAYEALNATYYKDGQRIGYIRAAVLKL